MKKRVEIQSAVLGPIDSNERYRVDSRRSTRRGEVLRSIWARIRTGAEFTVPGLAKETGTSKNYVKIYVRALRNAGYLVVTHPNAWNSPHNPARYKCGTYKKELAPQLAGGSGKTGQLGRGWKTLNTKV